MNTDTMRPLTTDEAACYLHVMPSTLATWRRQGRGPRYYRVGVRCVYRVEDLDAWLSESAVEPWR